MRKEIRWKIARLPTSRLYQLKKNFSKLQEQLEDKADYLKVKLALVEIAIDRIDQLLWETKYQIGKRRSTKCKLLKFTADGEWMCPARLKQEYSSRKLFQEENCSTCRLSPKQARLKATMNKILGLKPKEE